MEQETLVNTYMIMITNRAIAFDTEAKSALHSLLDAKNFHDGKDYTLTIWPTQENTSQSFSACILILKPTESKALITTERIESILSNNGVGVHRKQPSSDHWN